MSENAPKNLEAVEQTLSEIAAAQKTVKKCSKVKKFFYYAFFPFVKLYELMKKLVRKIHIPITAKTTIIYTLLFAVTLTLLGVFVVSSVENHMVETGNYDATYVRDLKLTMGLLILLAIAVIAALGSIASHTMISPIRKMIDKIDRISADDLSARIDNVDSQGELKELTERINAMLGKLEQSFDRQKKFVSDASHELKTPISVIQGYSNLLLRWGKDDPDVLNEGIDSIAREADNMKKIVEQLLTLAKMGKFNLTYETLDISSVLKEVADDYAIAVTTHKVVYSGTKNLMVNVDKNLFIESVRAIVDNAVKYSPEDSIVRIYCDENQGYASIRIVDSGIGISQEDLPHVFDRFFRCDKSRNRGTNSTGLGLTIAKSIIETMDGTIEVKSELGKGSTFHVRLPVKGGEK